MADHKRNFRRQTRKQARRRQRKAKKPLPRPDVGSTAAGVSPVIFREYYQPALSEIIEEATQLPEWNRSFSGQRASFWRPHHIGKHSGPSALALLDDYLASVEKALEALISRHSLAYWLHLTRRLAPVSLGFDTQPATIWHLRAGIVELLVCKDSCQLA